jgi:RNA polymerase sigma factor (sigma-70 family)
MATAAPEIPSVARARARAFEVLYRRHVQDVYRYTLAILRNPADAEDVTQTTFMNAYRAYMAGTVPLKPQNWLIKIAHNAARTRHARAARRVREVPLDDHLEQLAVPEEDKPDVREVLDALGRLPLNQRAALVMRELEGRSYAEIADTLGVSVPAVETLIFRARRSLRVNASAVRVLGVVPLPSSLSQLFNAGGIVAGGGTAVGSGFLLKAAVAVVAGVVATGVGGDHQRRPRAAVQPAWGGANGQRLSPDLAASVRAAGRAAARPAQATGAGTTADPAGRAGADDAAHETSLPSQETGSAPTAAPPPSTTAATPATTTSAVTGVTGTVTDATGSVTTSVPSVEPPPVELPPLPSVPGLPVPPPSLPSLP